MTAADESHALALRVSARAREVRETVPTFLVDGRFVDRETFDEHHAVAVAIFGTAYTQTTYADDGSVEVELLRPPSVTVRR